MQYDRYVIAIEKESSRYALKGFLEMLIEDGRPIGSVSIDGDNVYVDPVKYDDSEAPVGIDVNELVDYVCQKIDGAVSKELLNEIFSYEEDFLIEKGIMVEQDEGLGDSLG